MNKLIAYTLLTIAGLTTTTYTMNKPKRPAPVSLKQQDPKVVEKRFAKDAYKLAAWKLCRDSCNEVLSYDYRNRRK
jgi:hypothetical protein